MNPFYAHRPTFELDGLLEEIQEEIVCLQNEYLRLERLAQLQAEEADLLRELREREDADPPAGGQV